MEGQWSPHLPRVGEMLHRIIVNAMNDSGTSGCDSAFALQCSFAQEVSLQSDLGMLGNDMF